MITLSQAASAIYRENIDRFEAAALDAGFDAGEFSGPEHGRAHDEALATIARKAGFADVDALADALAARTSQRWVHFELGI